MKTEFVSLVSHQLRSPLTAIKYSAELLADQVGDKADKNTMEYIGAISQYTSNMVALINSLLNISRIESGRLAINPEPTDLEKLTQSVIKEVGGGSKIKNQTLTVEAIKNLPKINIDIKLIYEVIKNILTNAIKYTPKKGKINISILVDANNVILQVSDNGYGIPKKEQDKIFQKFHRASNVANNIEGSGLGLYLVKIIIKVSGGKIWFESKEGKGTTFWLSLPLSGSPAKAGEVSLG
jgi:signal transduction histidine kinase